ncbi:hypothetical protein [Chryseobacterium indologenes]|uniref:hypothetical protein n=1 Tax=Chryseobacterium indologenes TaxID=253 RepID=UPI0009A1B2FB|nr:hypothetical protein [Chryseobacterium indologenes]
MKELEELTREIREKLPRLKELSEGCHFSMETESGFHFKYKVLQVYGGGQIADTGDYDDVYLDISSDYDGIEEQCYLDVIERKAEIIGKEPMLNDVLLWFKESDMKDGINMMHELVWSHTAKEIINHWNLSNPYLKDQSPELINFLHGLINH